MRIPSVVASQLKDLCYLGVLLAVLLSSGCATPKQMYPGERLPKSECATIEPWDSTSFWDQLGRSLLQGPPASPATPTKSGFSFSVTVTQHIPDTNFVTFIESIDDQKLGEATSAEVLPGLHSLNVGLRWKEGSNKPGEGQTHHLSFMAEAGNNYVVKAEASRLAAAATFWIEEEESNKVVAGFKPTEK